MNEWNTLEVSPNQLDGNPIWFIDGENPSYVPYENRSYLTERSSWLNNEFHRQPQEKPVLEMKMNEEITTDGIPVRKIFVSNIPKHVKIVQVFNIFKKYGYIVQVFISRKFANYVSKRTTFGFVTFRDTQSAARALSSKAHHILNDFKLVVTAADSWHQPIVNPDGSIAYYQSLCYNRNSVVKENENHDNLSEGDDIDDLVGAVGGITIRATSHQEAESSPISKLNDDCLELVFSHLSIIEKITAGKVCKRWQNLISNNFRKFEKLNLNDILGNSHSIYQTDRSYEEVELILEKVGPNLKELIYRPPYSAFDETIKRLNKSFILIVARYCTNLETLNISNVEIPERSFMFLSKQCPNLRKLSFRNCDNLRDHNLAFILRRQNSKLEELILIENHQIHGKCFASFQSSLKHLGIIRCGSIFTQYLLFGLSRVKESLESLSINDCRSWDIDISAIASALPKLKYLTIPMFQSSISEVPLDSVGNFSELVSLDLSNNLLTNNIINNVVNSCKQLKYLNISGGYSSFLNPSTLSQISEITNLEELNLSNMELVNDEVILKLFHVSLPNLKKLHCVRCYNLSDKGAVRVLTSCKNLEYFDVRDCGLITNETIEKALNVVQKRKNIPLKIKLFGTRVSMLDELSIAHPLLDIDFSIGSSVMCTDGLYDFCFRLDCNCHESFLEHDEFLSGSDNDDENDSIGEFYDYLMDHYDPFEFCSEPSEVSEESYFCSVVL